MKYLIDTDVLSYFLRGDKRFIQLFSTLLQSQDELFISVITWAEITYGLELASKNPKVASVKQILDQAITDKVITILDLTQRSAYEFGVIKSSLRSDGEIIMDMDILIAATARSAGLTMITNNFKHFSRIKGLKLLDFTA